MVLPWNRRDVPPQAAPGRRRRRRRDEPNRAEEVRRQGARREEERRRQRLAITIGTMLIIAILAIVAAGYYREFYEPPRVMAGSIRGIQFNMGDLVERIRVVQGVNRYQGGRVDLSVLPFEYLQGLLNSEILRQAAPSIGIFVTREELDQVIRAQFTPVPRPGEEPDPGQSNRLFESNYQEFLTLVNLTDEVYRRIIEEGIQRQQLAVFLARDIPEKPEQVEVEWIRLEFDGPVSAGDVRARLEEEEFAAVAAEIGVSAGYADREGGYVGWVPQGAFPDFDELLFGNEEEEIAALEVGDIGDPQFTSQDGIYIIHLLSEPEERELDPLMRRKLIFEMVSKWQSDQLSLGSNAGWLKINFDSDRYAWVADQVRVTAPRLPPEAPQNQGLPFPGGG